MPQIPSGKPAGGQLPNWTYPTGKEDVGSFDVSGGLEAGAHLISPLVSIYKSKAAREAATQEFRQSIADFLSSNAGSIPEQVANAWRGAGEYIVSRYPRVAAHVRQSPDLSTFRQGAAEAGASISTPEGRVTSPMTLRLHTAGLSDLYRSANAEGAAKNVIAHELTHAAQSLGNSDSAELYDLASNVLPYKVIPYETTARLAGSRAELGAPRMAQTPLDELKQRLATLLAHPAIAHTPAEKDILTLVNNANQTGNWSNLQRLVNNYGVSTATQGTNKAMRQIAELGFKEPQGSPARAVATRITKIMNRREAMPLAKDRGPFNLLRNYLR